MNLLELDTQLFQLINGHWHNGFLDAIIPLWRNKLFWMPFYAFIATFFAVNFGKKGLLAIVLLVATIGLSDFVSSRVVKKTVKRVRPCNEVRLQNSIRLVMKCGKSYSFTSSHAANHTAIAFYLIFVLGTAFKWVRIPLFLWAFSVGYSQIYIGAHYPLDVVGGILIGFVVGLIGAEAFRRLDILLFKNQ